MKRLLVAAAMATVLLVPTPAAACMELRYPAAMLHSALPNPLPAGAIVAEVEVARDASVEELAEGVRVRVLRMLQGEPAPELILRAANITSCHTMFDEDPRGLIVAIPDGHRDGVPIAWPVFAERDRGYRLPDGYVLPPLSQLREWRRSPISAPAGSSRTRSAFRPGTSSAR